MFVRWASSDDAKAYGSWGNGAPMRVAAVGWLAANETEAESLAAAQSAVSHDHPQAISAAQAVARTILALRQGEAAGTVRKRIAETYGYDLRPETALVRRGFDVSAAGTVPPALAAAFEARDFEHAVRTAVGLGGDTDTLACITGAVAEAFHGMPRTIARQARAHLTDDLEQVLRRFEERLRGERLP